MPVQKHIPYRGETYPKRYGHPSPEKPYEQFGDALFLSLVAITGAVAFIVAVVLTAQGNYGGIFVFVLYLMFAGIAFFGLRDSKKIKTITPDQDDPPKPKHDDGSSLAEDYFAQIDWQHTHHHRHHPASFDAPEPKWRYRRVETTSQFTGYRSLRIYAIFIGSAVLIPVLTGWISQTFGISSTYMIILLVVLGIAIASVYLILQDD